MCIAVCSAEELVVVSVKGRVGPLLELAAMHSGDLRGELAKSMRCGDWNLM
ncbi:MAG: hypothetical protein J6386_23300 [Candidatus Synoicihabitans palmerolidicus]|nr:hypothetical protein [Candidatus Synoicihabitans palmerolidicus]